ncbi:MAG TPA: DMT family transporter, partial [Burkholderiales bacterium]
MGGPRKAHALAALFAGAVAIGTSALFVKVSETGPVATAFWRVALALPVLWTWAWATDRRAGIGARGASPETRRMMVWAGAFFAGDLAVWHWSIILTSIATATLLANLAPLFVALAAWLLFRRPPGAGFAGALALALAGMMLLVQGDFGATGHAWLGDVLGVITAMFYAAYQITVNRVRAQASTARIMAWSSAVTAVLLAPVVWLSGETWLPMTGGGWLKLVG